MTFITESLAAASATLGTDLLRDSVHRLASEDRIITGAQFTGSAAAGDCAVEIYVSDVLVATLYGLKTGGPASAYEMVPIDAYVPGGAEVRAIVIDEPGTNPVFLVMEIDEDLEDEEIDPFAGMV